MFWFIYFSVWALIGIYQQRDDPCARGGVINLFVFGICGGMVYGLLTGSVAAIIGSLALRGFSTF